MGEETTARARKSIRAGEGPAETGSRARKSPDGITDSGTRARKSLQATAGTEARARKSLRTGEPIGRATTADAGTRVRKTIAAGESTPSRSRAVAAETSTAARPRKMLSSDTQSSPAAPRRTIGQVRPAMHAAEDREAPGGRHRRSAERPENDPTGRHRMTPDNPTARHRAEQNPAHAGTGPGQPAHASGHPAHAANGPGQEPQGGADEGGWEQPLRPAPPAEAPVRPSTARHAQPQPVRPPVDPETGLPPGMTRGILELAAERLAAARAASAAQPADDDADEPEAEETEPADEMPRPTRRAGRSAGGPGLRGPGAPAAGTRPGLGSRPPLASRPPAGPPEAVRPPTTPMDHLPVADPGSDLAAPEPVRRRRSSTPLPEAPLPGASFPEASFPEAPIAEVMEPGSYLPMPPNRQLTEPPVSTRRPRGSRPVLDAPIEEEPEGPQLVRPIREPEPEQIVDEPDPSAQHDRSSRRRPIVRAATDVEPAVARPDFYRAPAVPAEDPYREIEMTAAVHDTAEFPRVVPEHETEDETWFWSTSEHPTGLPESVRLPAGIPEGLWHPAEHEPDPEPAGHALPQGETVDVELPVHDDRPTHEQAVYVEPAAIEAPEPEIVAPSAVIPHQALVTSGETPVVEIDRTSPPPDVDGLDEVRSKLTPSGRKLLRRRRRVTFLAYIIVVSLVLVVGHELRDRQRPAVVDQASEPIGAVAPQVQDPPTPDPAKQDQETHDQVGSVQGVTPTAGEASGEAGNWRYVKTRGPELGKSGKMHRFRVAVEETVPDVKPDTFAKAIDSTLGDDRSWIASGKVRLRRVPKSAETDFTIYLASAATSEKMCSAGGLHTEGFTSCRVPGQVIINAERWADAVPDYDGELWEYRQYAINHEVGHELGHGHESCPGKGKAAPVMLQQTYGLDGCTRNAWPYLDGERYEGEPRP